MTNPAFIALPNSEKQLDDWQECHHPLEFTLHHETNVLFAPKPTQLRLRRL